MLEILGQLYSQTIEYFRMVRRASRVSTTLSINKSVKKRILKF
jgi:hypothetical protein